MPDAADAIMAALDGLPPPRLLVNNASRFVHDDIARFHRRELGRASRRQPARAGLAVAGLRRARPSAGLIVNLLDAKLAAPNPDFFSYTISKIGLAGLTELSARAFAPGIRVCGIAPSVTLVSGPAEPRQFRQGARPQRARPRRRGRGDRRRLALHHRHAEPHRPDDHCSTAASASFPCRATCSSWSRNDAEHRPARRPRPRAARAEDAQDRARGLRPAGRHRLPRFRGRQAAAAAGHGRGLGRRAQLRRHRRARRAPGITISCAPRSARSPTAAASTSRRRSCARSTISSPPAAASPRCASSTRKPDIYPDCAGVGVELSSF